MDDVASDEVLHLERAEEGLALPPKTSGKKADLKTGAAECAASGAQGESLTEHSDGQSVPGQ